MTALTKKELEAAIKVYAKVKFNYNCTYIMPYEEGIALMSHFAEAEEYDESDYNNHKIIPMKHSPELSILSRDEYTELKMKNLLLPSDDEE